MASEKDVRKLLERNDFVDIMSDVNLAYGGYYVREEEPGTYDVIELVDLDSAAGADGQILVTARITSAHWFDAERIEYALASMDAPLWLENMRISTEEDAMHIRMMLALDLIRYGLCDPAGYGASWFVAVLDREGERDAREKWEENRVKGWGWAAVMRAVENAIDACDHRMCLTHDITL